MEDDFFDILFVLLLKIILLLALPLLLVGFVIGWIKLLKEVFGW